MSLNLASNTRLSVLVPQALERLERLLYNRTGFCVGHSGGKDSSVVHHLTNVMAGLNLPVAHTSKTVGFNAIHPKTLEFLYSRPFVIELYPEGIKFPYRGQIDGTRASEAERLNKSTDLIVNGEPINRKYMTEYNPSGLFGMEFVYPIYNWTDEDVWDYHSVFAIARSAEYDTP